MRRVDPTRNLRTYRRRDPVERMGLIKVGGKDATIIGDDVKVGDTAPEFTAHKTDWS